MKLLDSSPPPILGCCILQSCQGLKDSFPSFSLAGSVKDWAEKWFYVPKPSPSFSSNFSSVSTVLPVWKDKLSAAELESIKPLLVHVDHLKQADLTGNGLVASFVRHRVQPLMKRENYGFEYTRPEDSSRIITETELSDEMVFDRLKRVFSNVTVMPARVDEYDAAHPPPVVIFLSLSEFF